MFLSSTYSSSQSNDMIKCVSDNVYDLFNKYMEFLIAL